MSLIVLVVNEDRYLINEESKASDKQCEQILSTYPNDAVVSFDRPIKGVDYRA